MRIVDVRIERDRGTVTIESTKEASVAIQELLSTQAKELALTEARKAGLLQPGYGMIPYPYPVDVNGNVINDATGLPVAYRVDIPVLSAAL